MLDVVVPRLVGEGFVGIAPAHHERAVPLLDRPADEGVVGLEIEDVVLVDARRHEEHGPLVHGRAERLVFDELEQLVLEHHRAFGRGHVAADLEHGLVGLRDVALLDVLQEVRQALRDALAARLDGLALSLRIEREEVARARRIDPLLNGEADALARLLVAFHRLGHLEQCAGVEQVDLRGERGGRVLDPFAGGEAAVGQRGLGVLRIGSHALDGIVPDLRGLLQVVGLQLGQCRHRQAQLGERTERLADGRTERLRAVARQHGHRGRLAHERVS